MAIFGDFFASCIYSEPRAARFRLHLKFALRPATPCVEVWQTSNLRRLRLGEEKKKERKKERRRNHRIKIWWSALFHRATIKRRDFSRLWIWMPFARWLSKSHVLYTSTIITRTTGTYLRQGTSYQCRDADPIRDPDGHQNLNIVQWPIANLLWNFMQIPSEAFAQSC